MTLIHSELSYAVIGCAQKVHSALGPGFPEAVYHRALCQALMMSKIAFESQKEFEVYYENVLCGKFKADLFVDGTMIVEIKAVDRLCDAHEAQVLAYLKASGARVALLINFGEKSLVFKRYVH